jgi:hypothetical protein
MPFDIETYKARSGRLDLEGVDFGAFATEPLDQRTLRCLRYMHDIEHHTVCYLRDLLVTRAHRDPEMTTFLMCWGYEELWHGEAIAAVLGAHGERSGAERLEPMRRRLHLSARLAPLLHGVGSAITGVRFTAVHMTWGAINEWTTQSAYARLAARANSSTLTTILKRIMRQEGRHIDFYATQAEKRLEGDRAAQRLTRIALRKFWNPVGSDVMPPDEVQFLVSHLFGEPEGADAARRVDRRIDRLPGLDGLGLVERAAVRYAA